MKLYDGLHFGKDGQTPKRRRAARRRLAQQAQAAVRPEIVERQFHQCLAVSVSPVCVGGIDHPHHVRRQSHGGEDSADNEIGVCHACHDAIHAGDLRIEYAGDRPRAGELGNLRIWWRGRQAAGYLPIVSGYRRHEHTEGAADGGHETPGDGGAPERRQGVRVCA